MSRITEQAAASGLARAKARNAKRTRPSLVRDIDTRAPLVRDPALPGRQGLYDPANEHDSCGVGFIADMHNRKSHDIVAKGLQILENLDHRGAVGADPKLGDGCGVLVQIPHRFFFEECARLGIHLPAPGDYAVGQFFMPRDAACRAADCPTGAAAE